MASKSKNVANSSEAGGANKKRNYPIFERENVQEETKRRKEGDLLKIWSWNVAGLRACVKVCSKTFCQLIYIHFRKVAINKLPNPEQTL